MRHLGLIGASSGGTRLLLQTSIVDALRFTSLGNCQASRRVLGNCILIVVETAEIDGAIDVAGRGIQATISACLLHADLP